MNNPYSELRHFKGKRSFGRKIRRLWILVSRFPVFLIWQILRLFPDELGRRLRRRLRVLIAPFQSLIDLLMSWLTTRAWIHLLFALPLIVIMAWIASTMFLAKSMSQEELYKGYRKNLFNAVQSGDFRKADFMAGKLLNKAVYGRDEPMLYAAMIAAHEAGNMPRRDMLRQRLTTDLQSPRAHMWSASMLIRERFKVVGAVSRAIEHINKAIELSDDEASIKEMKMQLMKIYYEDGRQLSAIQILDELGIKDHRMGVLKGNIYLRKGEKIDALNAAMDTLDALDNDESTRDEHMKVRLDALTILTDAGGEAEFVIGRLNKLIVVLEGKLVLSPDDQELKSMLAQSCMILGRLLLQSEDVSNKRSALRYLDKVLSAGGRVPSHLGRLLLFASNLNASSNAITEQQIRNALVHGEGVMTGHILLGLNAWHAGQTNAADFHFRMVHSHKADALRVLEHIAMQIARQSGGMGQSPIGFSLQKEPEWRRALGLLKLTAKIDKVPLGDNLKFQCMILAENQYWHEVIALLEPHIEKISGSYRLEFLQILIKAYAESGNLKKAGEYNQLLKEEMQSM